MGVSSISCAGYRNIEHTAVNVASDFVRDDSVCSCDEMADSILLTKRGERERDHDSLLTPLPCQSILPPSATAKPHYSKN